MVVGAAGGRPQRRWPAIALVALACLLLYPAAAAAATFTVDSTADEVDAAENGECLTAEGKCTLRAALEEANDTPGTTDQITFDESVFDCTAAGTITLGGSLPTVVGTVRIKAARVDSGGNLRPCVGVTGKSGEPALTIDKAANVQIDGLAITGAQPDIDIEGSAGFRIRTSWLGVNLDGSVKGDAAGILLGPGSSSGQIGSEGAGFGNVFAGSSGDGLQLEGAAHVKVLGNYFGVKPDGATAAPNGENIVIASTAESEAVGNTIGVKVTPEAAASAACDGGCNVISGAGSNGIDLAGDGGPEEPASATTVLGNYVGLDASGSTEIPNAGAGILVGEAAQTVVGGSKTGEANLIDGGKTGVRAGPEAADLVVRGNTIGTNGEGAGLAPDEAIVVDSGELASPAVEASILDNLIELQGGVGIAQQGFGARIADNFIVSAEPAIEASGLDIEHGNSIEGNVALDGGIVVENDFNEIVGNEVVSADGPGIWIDGSSLPFGVSENLVGGDSPIEENVIIGSGGAAIEISNPEDTENVIARNNGIINGGLFIDLVAASPGSEPGGPNKGIKPPVLATATTTAATGSAQPGATVRVFRKHLAEPGELESFLGEAIADEEGNWEVAYEDSLSAGTIVAATQTSEAGGTSELASATTSGEAGGSGGSGGGGAAGASAAGAPPSSAPQTRIVSFTRKRPRGGDVRFEFRSNEPGATFQCRLDGGRFKPCKSPKRYAGLAPGKHVFEVRAVDAAGAVDPKPAKKKFDVVAEGGR